MKLNKISKIRTGLVLSRKKATIKEEVKHIYNLLTLQNLSSEGTLLLPFEKYYSTEELGRQYFTKEGDILFRMTHPFDVIYIDRNYEGLLVPSSFSIIKIQVDELLPEYVAWYLNRENIAHSIKKIQSGTSLASTSNKVLGDLDIQLIPIKDQKIITELYLLNKKEIELLQEMLKEKKKLYQGAMESLLKKEK